MTLQGKVHDLLVEAGAAQGIKPEEAMILIALGNDTLLNEVKTELKKTKTPEEYAHICTVLDEAAAKHRAVQQKAVRQISDVAHQQTGVPQRSLQQQITDQQALSAELDQLLLSS